MPDPVATGKHGELVLNLDDRNTPGTVELDFDVAGDDGKVDTFIFRIEVTGDIVPAAPYGDFEIDLGGGQVRGSLSAAALRSTFILGRDQAEALAKRLLRELSVGGT
jgi:hypothetical protein